MSYRLFFPLRHYKEERMRRRARPKQSDLFESPAEISMLLPARMRAEVVSLICALLMEVASQEQFETITREGSKHEQDRA
jgi:TATA-binding protein-associated factor Taf7